MKTVEIRKQALVQMIASAYEALRVETCGFLAGEIAKTGKRYYVELAQPLQIADRKPGAIEYETRYGERLKKTIERSYDFLGGFHTHLRTRVQKKGEIKMDRGRVKLGKFDYRLMRDDYPKGIEIVLAVNPDKEVHPPSQSEYRIIGYLPDCRRNWRFEIGAYYLNSHIRKRKARIEVSRKTLKDVFD